MKNNLQEVNISSDLSNLDTEIPSVAQDDQPPLEPFEEVLAGEFNKAMMYDE